MGREPERRGVRQSGDQACHMRAAAGEGPAAAERGVEGPAALLVAKLDRLHMRHRAERAGANDV